MISHAFVSGKADGGDATLVRPSDWNAAHTITDITLSGATPFVELPNYTTPAVSSANAGRLAYESASQQLRLSRNGAGYVDVLAGNLTANSLPYASAVGLLSNMDGVTWANAGRALTWAQGTLTTSNPFITHTATLNAGGVTFHNYTSNVTVTAAANASTYARWQLGGNTRFALERTNSGTGDFAIVARNNANTARWAILDEFLTTGAISKFYGDGTITSYIIQSDPGASTPADSQAFRIGLFRDAYGTLGGANMANSFSWHNQATHNQPQFCMASPSTCFGTANAFMLIHNTEAAQSTRVQIRAGATQTGNPFLEVRNNANSSTLFQVTETGAVSPLLYSSETNCSSSAAPAVCAAAPAGSVTIAAGATQKVVNTTAVTANSQIIMLFDASLGTKLGVTCNTTAALPYVTARVAATSFTFDVSVAPVTNPACYSYWIIN